jgi:AhpD family alkylhydroperoxidase
MVDTSKGRAPCKGRPAMLIIAHIGTFEPSRRRLARRKGQKLRREPTKEEAMGTMVSRNDVEREIRETLGTVPHWVRLMPESALPAFWTLMRDFQLAETAIPNKYKELIGLAVSGATRCKYCTLFHTEAARLFGATDQEIAEASMMAAHTMSASTFVNAQQIDYDTFKTEVHAIVEYVKTQQAKGKPAQPKDKVARA